MLIKESWCELRNYGEETETRLIWGESDLYTPYTENIKHLFLDFQREYGRCVSKVYVDISGITRAIGWLFLKRQKYEDCNKYYLQATWVELHDDKPDKTVKYHYHYL